MNRPGLIALIAAMGLALPAGAHAASVTGDYDGDGRADLAISVEDQEVNGHPDAGAVQVLYGSHSGPSGAHDRIFTEDTPGIKQAVTDSTRWGLALATGHFDGDRFADLAVGSPFNEAGGIQGAGTVHILYGSRHGLRGKGSQLFIEGKNGLKGTATTDNSFGYSLAAANLGRSGQDDLAIGALFEDVAGQDRAGAVQVLYGTRKGLRAKHSRRFTQNTPHVKDHAETSDEMGGALAAADFGHDGHADLAIGDREETVGSATEAGAVSVLYGSPKGLGTKGNQFLSQDTPGVKGTADPSEGFGGSLAAANFGRSGRADLAIGVPFESFGSSQFAGAANVLYGSKRGLRAKRSQYFTETKLKIGEGSEESDEFARSLAAANFGRGRQADLAAGVPGECVGPGMCANGGAADVIYGSRHGLTGTGAEDFNEDTPGIADFAAADENFGFAIAAGRFRGKRVNDLAIGIPLEDVVNTDDKAGAVSVLRGSAGGVTANGDLFLTQGSNGLNGTPEQSDQFGAQLSGPNSQSVFD